MDIRVVDDFCFPRSLREVYLYGGRIGSLRVVSGKRSSDYPSVCRAPCMREAVKEMHYCCSWRLEELLLRYLRAYHLLTARGDEASSPPAARASHCTLPVPSVVCRLSSVVDSIARSSGVVSSPIYIYNTRAHPQHVKMIIINNSPEGRRKELAREKHGVWDEVVALNGVE